MFLDWRICMRITSLHIENFKSIRSLTIHDIEQAMILVGKNNTGKTVVLEALLVLSGQLPLKKEHFNNINKKVVISGTMELNEDDLTELHDRGMVSKYKNMDKWMGDFQNKIPCFENGVLTFSCVSDSSYELLYSDGVKKNNQYLKKIFPKIYYIDHNREIQGFQNDILEHQAGESFRLLKENLCMFDKSKQCKSCFQCIGLIDKKSPEELDAYETAKLLEYKLLQSDLVKFETLLNENFKRNGGTKQEIGYQIDLDFKESLKIKTEVFDKGRNTKGRIGELGAGFKSIYLMSLLQTYMTMKEDMSSIIMIEDPEMFLHPELQKKASEILYGLSKKNQVIFCTHSPNMIFNFSQKQIKQVVLNEEYQTTVKENEEIDEILDDLGYNANDLMNVNFVFIVEGKQDGARLPLLLEKYYSEIYDEEGNLQRVAIIPTNSCTNIKTYANLKYINKLYLKDQFLMIRDSDGKNPKHLIKQLCSYYSDREMQDENNLPRVTPKNVLVLKYYSFENYFLDPQLMVKIGVIKNEEEFYNTLYCKWKDYLYKLGSSKRMLKALNIRINSKQDIKNQIENIKIYVRGHNLFDIFYGRYKGSRRDEILKAYVDVAPRETFKDILDAIDKFVYFENRKKQEEKEKKNG